MAAAATPSPEYLAETRGPMIRTVTWLSVIFPILFVGLRVYTRLFVRKVFGLDDWVIVISLILLICYGAIIEAAVQKGLGRHVEWVLTFAPQDAVPVALLGQVSQPFVVMSCALGKTSFSISLMRLAAQRFIHRFLWFIVVTMLILHILISIFVFVHCEDPRATWNPAIVSKCWHPNSYLGVLYFIGAYSAATDFILALLPWAMLWNLNMKNKEKFGVAVAMSLGVFAGAIAVIKCTKLKANATSTDPTYDVGELLLTACAENALIIMAACIPTLRPMLRKVFPSSAKSSENSHRLKNMNNIMFVPKNKAGQWSALVETEAHPDHTSDNQSDKSILKEHRGTMNDQGNAGPAGGPSSPALSPHIRKTMSVNVSYDRSNNLKVNNGRQALSYIPLDTTDHELPPSYILGDGNEDRESACIQYVIEAKLKVEVHGKTEIFEAVLPFKMIQLTPDAPIVDFKSRQIAIHERSQIRKSFSFSTDPELVFDVFVDVPRIIQLDNPTPIPIKLLVAPDWQKTSPIIQNVPQELKLTAIHIWIATETSLNRSFGGRRTEVDLGVVQALNKLKMNLRITFTRQWEPIDLGELSGLRIGLQDTGFPEE
ncbi:integral membrane protein PTH11 [Fusarium phyllophilum]|uniref:Integral membrane protein PTH11 n=1 Tax=Fusarium phyllophilum TaxID=47803 RepID=A0A8H5NFH2_9HYPO|nr:integral membrane protein PTH11 [Fusarium phyllophilum]